MVSMRGNSVRVAGIDCGTNSIRLLIADVSVENGVGIASEHMQVVVPKIMHVVRLGQDIDKNHRFADGALERTYHSATQFAQIIKDAHVDTTRFVATSATRDAQNRKDFEETILSILGVCPEVVSGNQEAALSFLGATSVIDSQHHSSEAEAPFLVVDLGGGSTELVRGGLGNQRFVVRSSYSMDIGSVRMTERHLRDDPPTADQIEKALEDIDEHISQALRVVRTGDVRTLIGVSGTVTTMSLLAMGESSYSFDKVDGAVIPIAQARAKCSEILVMSRAGRAQYPVIHPGRIDVIGGGVLIWERLLARLVEETTKTGHPLESYIASEHGLLEGLTLDAGRRFLEGGCAEQ